MLQVFTYNAGKGDCIRLRFAESHNIFIYTGVIRFSTTFQKICNQIRLAGESLDVLILTHVDDDHIGGILGALRHTTYRCPFNEVWMNHSGNTVSGDRTLSVKQNDEVYSRLMAQSIKVIGLHEGDRKIVAGAVIDVYWPESNTSASGAKLQEYHESQLARHCDYTIPLSVLAEKELPSHDTSQNNKNSVVLSFSYDNHSLLFTGDAWAEDVVKAKGNFVRKYIFPDQRCISTWMLMSTGKGSQENGTKSFFIDYLMMRTYLLMISLMNLIALNYYLKEMNDSKLKSSTRVKQIMHMKLIN